RHHPPPLYQSRHKTPGFIHGDISRAAPSRYMLDVYIILYYNVSMQQKQAYKYRVYPTDEQKHVLAHTFGCARFVYNWALHQKTNAFYQEQQRLSYKDLALAFTRPKQQDDYLW